MRNYAGKDRYYVDIDAVANTMTLKDDSGNTFLLDSNIPRWFLTNRSMCSIDLFDKDLKIIVPDNMTTTVGKNYILTIDGKRILTVLGDAIHTFKSRLIVTVLSDYILTITGNMIMTSRKWVTTTIGATMTFTTWTVGVAKNLTFGAKKAAIADKQGKTLHQP